MRRGIESVGEELDDAAAAEFTGRQADRMDDDQLDGAPRRTLVAVGRWNPPGASQPSLLIYFRRIPSCDGSFLTRNTRELVQPFIFKKAGWYSRSAF
jgi:hypothetical protein